jgi:hypothetical protein
VLPVKYELGFYIPEDDILQADSNLKTLISCCKLIKILEDGKVVRFCVTALKILQVPGNWL